MTTPTPSAAFTASGFDESRLARPEDWLALDDFDEEAVLADMSKRVEETWLATKEELQREKAVEKKAKKEKKPKPAKSPPAASAAPASDGANDDADPCVSACKPAAAAATTTSACLTVAPPPAAAPAAESQSEDFVSVD